MKSAETDDNQKNKPPRKGGGAIFAFLILFVCVAAAGIIMRMGEAQTLRKTTETDAVTAVSVIKVGQSPQTEEVVLPGTVQAWHEAPIFARTSGYLKSWKTDIGTRVKAGDVIAEIETPEVDAQLHQAEADLASSEANNKLAQSTAKRWENLLKTNSVSKQDADEKSSAASASAAAVAASRANVDRLKQLEGFKTVVAPFDGVITARNTDQGALINAGSSGTALELFHIAETDKLRVYVQVPENYISAIHPDITADLHMAEHPGQVFTAKFSRTADAIDPVARTLLVEFEVDNADAALMPGGYAEVHIKLAASADSVRLPVNALLFRSEGLQIATLDANNHAMLKPIKVSRDFGNEVEVQSGIAPGETIIINPPDSLVNGQQVRVVTQEEQDKAANNKKGDDKKADKKESKTDDKKPDDKKSGDGKSN